MSTTVFPLTPHRNGFAATVQASVNITNCAETGVGSGCIGGKYACDQSHDRYRAHIHVSTKPVSSQVKSSSGATRQRGDHPGALLHAISSPHPYAGYGDLNGVGRRRNLSEAACYRNWPRSRSILRETRKGKQISRGLFYVF